MGLSKPFPFSHVGHRFPCSCFAMAVRRCTFHRAKYIARVLASSAALIAFAFMLCDGAAVLYFAPCKVHRFLGQHFSDRDSAPYFAPRKVLRRAACGVQSLA